MKKTSQSQAKAEAVNTKAMIFQISFWLFYFILWGWLLSKLLSR